MKISIFHHGQSIHVQRLFAELIDRGHDVYLLTNVDNSFYGSRSRNYLKLKLKNEKYRYLLSYVIAPFSARKILKRLKPDVIHAHELVPNCFLASFIGIHPVISSAWGTDILLDPERIPFYKPLIKYSFQASDVVTVNSLYARKKILQFGCPKSKMKLWYWGVDERFFNPSVYVRSNSKMRLGLNSDDIIVLCNRSHYPVYNVETLVKAAAIISKKIPNLHVLLVGEGPLTIKLRSLADSLNISNKITFVGAIDHETMPLFLRASDIYVSPSFFDTQQISLQEAMYCKVAPIVSSIPSMYEWIKDGETGLLFDPTNYLDLAEKILMLASNNDLRRQFEDRNFVIVKKKASWRNCVDELEKIYESVSLGV